MRELSFRVWDKERERMGKLQSAHFPLELEDEFSILMQNTGLKDKNGKKIFEGDILTVDVDGLKRDPLVVKFLDGAFLAVVLGKGPVRDIVVDDVVVGNIYENPDLLSKEEE